MPHEPVRRAHVARQRLGAGDRGPPHPGRQIVGRTARTPRRYLVVLFFDSYAEAMANPRLPETKEKRGPLRRADGRFRRPSWTSDVLEERTSATPRPRRCAGLPAGVECRTGRIEEMQSLTASTSSPSRRTTLRGRWSPDRNDRPLRDRRLLRLLRSAMENSDLPEDPSLAEKMAPCSTRRRSSTTSTWSPTAR